jgi:eukaryotic-like serine/threonine-protein kinase
MTTQDRTGTVVAGCRLDALLGRGSMGEVWRGVQLALRRPVAVKILAVGPRGADQEDAILREARAIARVEHPDVVRVYDVRFEGDDLCLLLELVEGRTLLKKLREDGPFLEGDLLDAAAGVARGVAAIHAAGLVHRDLKLDNVILTEAGTPKITDFGLALGAEAKDGYAGSVVGTPAYISPEQWLGRPVDGRADLYAMGVMLYALATGEFPFRGATPEESRHAHLKTAIVDPRRLAPDLDAGLAALIVRLLRKDREKRVQTAAELSDALEACRRGEAVAGEVDAGPLELGQRSGEFACPGCGSPVPRGARACPGCARGFCRTCLTRLAGAGGLCGPCAAAEGPAPHR